jgi:hypothetical protein
LCAPTRHLKNVSFFTRPKIKNKRSMNRHWAHPWVEVNCFGHHYWSHVEPCQHCLFNIFRNRRKIWNRWHLHTLKGFRYPCCI